MESKMSYLDYHVRSSEMLDIDPSNDALVYIAERWELTGEQRYWLAFLYSTCYCAPTAFYMIQEFPDYENVDVGRLQRWWDKNKNKCVFQTDRRRVKTSNEFVPTFKSYREWVGSGTQQQKFYQFKAPRQDWSYQLIYDEAMKIRNVGRFTLFIYLEMVNLLTDFKCEPLTIDWAYADNCRKGLCAAYGEEDVQHSSWLDLKLLEVQKKVKKKCEHSNIFNIETTLCAYTKFLKGQRYVGYYLDRQKKEIEQMQANVTTGVCWDVLWQFRKETYKHLKE